MSDSIREALTAAVAEHAEPETETPSTDAALDTSSTPDPVDASASAADEGTVQSPDGDAAAAAAAPSTPAAPAAPEVAAPASWSTEERAAWAGTPKAARDAILRRETEMNRALQVSAGARRRVEALDKLSETYKPLLDSYGVTVEQAMPGLLATRAVLEVGTPEQKAHMVANICADFGLDIGILDQALTDRYANGQPTPRYNGQGQPDINRLVDERLNEHPLMVQHRAIQTERARAAVATVQSQLHFEAVRHTMADLIDQAKANGRDLAVDGAYRLACELHGLAAPAAAAPMSASDAGRALAAARNAAASVSGAPKPTPARKPGEGSLRDELVANLAAAGKRR